MVTHGFPQLICKCNYHLLFVLHRSSEDSIGLDTCLSIQQTLYKGTSDSKYRPSVLLERMVDAQYLGKKSGRGFYEYNN